MKLLISFGTRPEVIKLAPVVAEARRRAGQIDLVVCSTGQHRQMLDQALDAFKIKPDIDLALMREAQALSTLVAEIITRLSEVLTAHRPDVVLVQGDTASAFAAALAAFYCRIPVGHVEAGLRTGDLGSPFPEELNRVLIARIARWHFAPTTVAATNLLRENVNTSTIHVTGNTVVDAIDFIRRQWVGGALDAYSRSFFPGRELVLVTTHRRENHGPALLNICEAVRSLSRNHPDLGFVVPVHLNPEVRGVVFRELHGLPNLFLTDPVDFETSLYLQSRSRLIITDSGGIQEEAPSFAVPCVVIREHTERSEGVGSGFASLAGTEVKSIVRAAETYLTNPTIKMDLARHPNPYGDGLASRRIMDVLLGEETEPFHG